MVERSEMETKRLDDLLDQIPGKCVDYLKIDVQAMGAAQKTRPTGGKAPARPRHLKWKRASWLRDPRG